MPPRRRESQGCLSACEAYRIRTVAETHRSSSAGPTSRPRPGQAQEQASGTMRRSGSPDQSRSRKKLRPCHGPWPVVAAASRPSIGVTPGPRRRGLRREGREVWEGKNFSLTPETAPADAHHGLQRDMQRRGSSVQCLGCTISKGGTLSAACQQPSLSSRHEAASVRHRDSLSNRDQPVQRVVWFELSRFGTYCVVTMHATSRSPMDGESKARMGLRPRDPRLGPCPRPIDETCATSENGRQLFVICRVVTPKTQWQPQHCPEPFGAAQKCHIPTTRGGPWDIPSVYICDVPACPASRGTCSD